MTSPFWNAYSSAVENHLSAATSHDEVFAFPFTVRLTDATGPQLTDNDVNYLLYKLANTTLAADGSTGDYATELNTYLKTVHLDFHPTSEAKGKLRTAEKELVDAKGNLLDMKRQAETEYEDDSDDCKPSFERWADENYPEYRQAQRRLDIAETEHQQAYNYYHGPNFASLEEHQKKLEKALKKTNQSYNMPVKNNAGHTGFAPSYHSPGLKKQLNDWIQDGGQEKTFFDLNIGHATPPGVPVEQEIHLKLTTKGIRKFEIDIGDWHVSGVKTLYPKRKRGAPNALDPKYARPISFLLAYDPKLKVEITQLKEDGDQNATTAPASDDKPYVTVLGILGKHFSPNASN